MAKVEFHFDFGSPNAYLAHLVVPQIEQRTGAKFEYVPVLLGGVFASCIGLSYGCYGLPRLRRRMDGRRQDADLLWRAPGVLG